MLRSPRFYAAVLASAALSCLLVSGMESRASSALSLDLQGLVDGAEAGLEARVLETRVELDLRGRPCTVASLSVARDFLGNESGFIEIKLPGGVLPDGSGMILAGMPRLAAGEEVVLFLSEESSTGLRIPVGLAQGKFRIVRDASGARTLVREGADLQLLDTSSSQVSRANLAAVHDYADAVARIEAAVSRRRARASEDK